ncbi:MAG: thioredoxin-disulfide reductase [Dehalococcoidia bacterium]
MARQEFDVAVVGAGPAGLTAGLYCARANLTTALLERGVPGGQLLNTDVIEDWPGEEHITGVELAQKFEAHMRKFGIEVVMKNASQIYVDGDRKIVETDDGDAFAALAVIVTAGGEPRKLDVPGEKELQGRGVSYCAVCDGPFFKDQVMAVIGGGDSACQEAVYLTRFASKVYLIHRRDEFRASKDLQERAFTNPKIGVVRSHSVQRIVGDTEVGSVVTQSVKDNSTQTLELAGVFIFIGFDPYGPRLFRDHIKHDEQCYILTDSKMETEIPGVFAAGDTRAQLARQITTAVGDGTTAAIAAEHYIESLPRAPSSRGEESAPFGAESA